MPLRSGRPRGRARQTGRAGCTYVLDECISNGKRARCAVMRAVARACGLRASARLGRCACNEFIKHMRACLLGCMCTHLFFRACGAGVRAGGRVCGQTYGLTPAGPDGHGHGHAENTNTNTRRSTIDHRDDNGSWQPWQPHEDGGRCQHPPVRTGPITVVGVCGSPITSIAWCPQATGHRPRATVAEVVRQHEHRRTVSVCGQWWGKSCQKCSRGRACVYVHDVPS